MSLKICCKSFLIMILNECEFKCHKLYNFTMNIYNNNNNNK